MLVTYILGDCPRCGDKNCFGNVLVHSDRVLRGCKICNYKTNVWLPKVRKKILYLDQFFFSSSFREGDPRFVKAAQRIRRLCELQLLVVPFSSIHEDETHQWGGFGGKNKEDLIEFIKATSRGHEFEPAYNVELTQIIRAFQAFLLEQSSEFALSERDVVRGRIHGWDDYFRIDVNRYIGNVELIRELKLQSIEELLDAFNIWRKSTSTFDQDVAFELRASGKTYLDSYFEYLIRFASGHLDILNRPLKSTVIERMLLNFPEETIPKECLKQVVSFFLSKHFAEIPYQWLATRMFAKLKDMVKRGAYANREKAQQRLNGIFYDIEHIAIYAPYCDAFIMDQPMAALVSDPHVGLEKRYGVKVYSLNSWDRLFAWLDKVENEMTDEHKAGLSAAYPRKSFT